MRLYDGLQPQFHKIYSLILKYMFYVLDTMLNGYIDSSWGRKQTVKYKCYLVGWLFQLFGRKD